jgi:hypothetical protein
MEGEVTMKRAIIFFMFLLVTVSLIASAQVIQLQVQIYPQQVLVNAPFKVLVSAYSMNSNDQIAAISAIFNGVEKRVSGSTASFEFIAPSINTSSYDFPLEVKVLTQNGETFEKDATITVSVNANPVIFIDNPIPSNNSNIRGTVEVPVQVYGGLGLSKIEFMVDTRIASTINVNPSSTVKLLRTFVIDTNSSHLQNGWHIFSVKVVNITGEIFSTIAGYVVNNAPPYLEFENINSCVPASTYIPVHVTAQSTLSGIASVYVNNVRSMNTVSDIWEANILTPSQTGTFTVVATATDGAGNTSEKSVELFSDGLKPTVSINYNFEKIKDGVFWRINPPLIMSLTSTTACKNMRPELSVFLNGTSIGVTKTISSGYSSEAVNTFLATPGNYNLTVIATDPINGSSEVLNKTLKVDFDPVPPQILNITYPATVGPDQFFRVTVSATDNNGIGISEIDVNGIKATQLNDTTWFATLSSVSPQKSGSTQFTVSAYNYLGNFSFATKSYFVDVNPPYISITITASSYMKGVYWNKVPPMKIEVSATTNSKVSPQMEILINNDDPVLKNTDDPVCIALDKPGTYNITVVSTNPINELSSKLSKTYVINFDTSSPTILNITSPATLGPHQAFRVTISATDTGIGISKVIADGINAVNVNNTTWIATLLSPQTNFSGSNKFTVEIYDYLGREISGTKSYFVDAQPPFIDIKAVSSIYRNGIYWSKTKPSTVDIFTRTDSMVNPETAVFVNGDQLVKSQNTFNELQINEAGNYNVTVISTNVINGMSYEKVRTFEFNFDDLPPQILNVTYPATVGPNQSFKVTVSATDDSGIGISGVEIGGIKAIELNCTTWFATLSSINPQTSESTQFTVKAYDYLGNKLSMTKSYFVDVEPPVIQLYLNGKALQNGSELYLFEKATPTIMVKAFTRSGVKPVTKVRIDGNESSGNEYHLSGIHLIEITSVNPINSDVSKYNAKVALIVDEHAPELSLSMPGTITLSSSATLKLKINGKDLRYASLNVYDNQLLYSNVFTENNSYMLDLRPVFANLNGSFATVELKAVDMAGNASKIKDEIFVDTIGPKIVGITSKNGKLLISFDQDIFGSPTITLTTLNGNVHKIYSAKVEGKNIILEGFDLAYAPYYVMVDGITDEVGNVLMNNGSIWEF